MVFETNINSIAHFLSDQKFAFYIASVQPFYDDGERCRECCIRTNGNMSFESTIKKIKISSMVNESYATEYKIIPEVDVFIGDKESIVQVSFPDICYDVILDYYDEKLSKKPSLGFNYIIKSYSFSYTISNNIDDVFAFEKHRAILEHKISESLNNKINEFRKFDMGNRSKENEEWDIDGVTCDVEFRVVRIMNSK